MVYSIFNNADKLSNQNINKISLIWLSIGIIFTCLSVFINALAWKELVVSLGVNLKSIQIMRLYITTNILKYLPGGIWHFVERLRILNKSMPKPIAFSSVLLEPLLMLVAASLCIPFGLGNKSFYILFALPTLIFIPKLRVIIISKLASIKASTFSQIDPNLSFVYSFNPDKNASYPFKALFVEIIFVFVRFTGFFFCLKAFSISDSIPLSKWISTFSLSWVAGLVVPGAPGGVGVFEAASLIIAREGVPSAPFIASLLCYRLVSTISDLLSNVLVLLINPRKKIL